MKLSQLLVILLVGCILTSSVLAAGKGRGKGKGKGRPILPKKDSPINLGVANSGTFVATPHLQTSAWGTGYVMNDAAMYGEAIADIQDDFNDETGEGITAEGYGRITTNDSDDDDDDKGNFSLEIAGPFIGDKWCIFHECFAWSAGGEAEGTFDFKH
mmetsp:Transcript_1775/g.3990  ORF Transcript_1775/g.3990 Transcript_1775/m.3990 type:complete len:157 (+) Transcript_1775:1-471(+)